ncbi:hypothetical protein JCM14036_09920 [Desulfotomaculum defluvii]
MYWMYGLFKPDLILELGIKELKEKGFRGERLKLITLDPCLPSRQRLLDSMYQNDGLSLIDGIAIFSSIGMLFGVIYGSLMTIGSIAMGLIALIIGGLIGYIVDKRINKKRKVKYGNPSGEVIISVLCENEQQGDMVKNIYKEYRAVAIGFSPEYIK